MFWGNAGNVASQVKSSQARAGRIATARRVAKNSGADRRPTELELPKPNPMVLICRHEGQFY